MAALQSLESPQWVDCSWSHLSKEGAECGVKQSEASWWKAELGYDAYQDFGPGFWAGPYVNDNRVTLDQSAVDESWRAPVFQ